MTVRFYVADTRSGVLLGQLRPASWTLSEPVKGSSSGTLTVRVPQEQAARGRLADLVTPRTRQVIGADISDGVETLFFGGPIPRRSAWDRSTGCITVPLADWRYWWTTACILRPDAITGGAAPDYIVKATEQTTAMHALMVAGLTGVDPVTGIAGLNAPGLPRMVVDDAPDVGSDGVLRDVTVRAVDRYLGEELDSIRDRNDDGRADWYTYMERVDATTFRAHVAIGWPQRSSRNAPLLLTHNVRPFTERAGHGSLIADYSWPEGEDQPTRVYATGEGNPPDRVWAVDELPDVVDGDELVWEQVAGPFTGVVKKQGAFDHAAQILSQTGDPSGQATVTVPTDVAGIADLVAGDRVRLRITDPWLDYDLAAVRIIQRDLAGAQDQPTTQTLTLDLADAEALPVDDPGTAGITVGGGT